MSGEHLFSIYLPFKHVGVDVHMHPCILAEFEQSSDVVGGQPQVSARQGRGIQLRMNRYSFELECKGLRLSTGAPPKGTGSPDSSAAYKGLIKKWDTPQCWWRSLR